MGFVAIIITDILHNFMKENAILNYADFCKASEKANILKFPKKLKITIPTLNQRYLF